MSDIPSLGTIGLNVVPTINPAAFLASAKKIAAQARTSFAAAADVPLGERLGAQGAALSKAGTAITRLTVPVVAFGAASVAAAESYDNATRTIAQRTGATGVELSKLNKSFEGIANTTGASFGDVAEVMSNFNQRLNLTGKPLEDRTNQFLRLQRVAGQSAPTVDQVTKAMAAFNVPTAQQGIALDHLFVAAQKTAVPMNELVQQIITGGPALRAFGLDLDSSAALVGALGKEGVPATAVLTALRTSLKKLPEGADANKFLADTLGKIRQLAKAGDEGGARKLAIDTFGSRGGAALLDFAKRGQGEFKQLTADIASGGGAIDKVAAATLPLITQFKQMKNQITLALRPIGEAIIPFITKGLQGLKIVAQGFKFPGVGPVLGSAVALVALTGPLFKLGGIALSVVGNIGKAVTAIQGMSIANLGQAITGTGNLAVGLRTLGIAAAGVAVVSLVKWANDQNVALHATELGAIRLRSAMEHLASTGQITPELREQVRFIAALSSGAMQDLPGGTKVSASQVKDALKPVMDQIISDLDSGKISARQAREEYFQLAKIWQDGGGKAGPFQKATEDVTAAISGSEQKSRDSANALKGLAASAGQAAAPTEKLGVGMTHVALTSATLAYRSGLVAKGYTLTASGAERLQKAQDKLQLSNIAAARSQNAVADAVTEQKRAGEDLFTAEAKLAALKAPDPEKIRQAATDLASARSDLADKTDAIAEAERSAQSAQDDYNKVVADGVDKQRQLEEAVTSAHNAVIDSQESLDKLIAQGADHHDIEKARRDLAEKKSSEQDAVRNRDVTGPAEQARAEQDAAQKVQDAQRGVVKAIQDRDTAQQKAQVAQVAYDTAQVTAAGTAEQVASAQRDVEDAAKRVRDANLNLPEVILAAKDAASQQADQMFRLSAGTSSANAALATYASLLAAINGNSVAGGLGLGGLGAGLALGGIGVPAAPTINLGGYGIQVPKSVTGAKPAIQPRSKADPVVNAINEQTAVLAAHQQATTKAVQSNKKSGSVDHALSALGVL